MRSSYDGQGDGIAAQQGAQTVESSAQKGLIRARGGQNSNR